MSVRLLFILLCFVFCQQNKVLAQTEEFQHFLTKYIFRHSTPSSLGANNFADTSLFRYFAIIPSAEQNDSVQMFIATLTLDTPPTLTLLHEEPLVVRAVAVDRQELIRTIQPVVYHVNVAEKIESKAFSLRLKEQEAKLTQLGYKVLEPFYFTIRARSYGIKK